MTPLRKDLRAMASPAPAAVPQATFAGPAPRLRFSRPSVFAKAPLADADVRTFVPRTQMMKRTCLALALLLPLPLAAETLDCSLDRTCATNQECRDNADPVVLGVIIAENGQSARLTFGDQSMEMALVDDSGIGRTFLALREGSGIGLMTLGADGGFAASSNELTDGALVGSTSTGRCKPRNG